MVEETELLLLLLLPAAGVALSFAFGWNNSSFLVGNGVGSGSLTMREVLLTTSAGMLIGVAFVGPGMIAGAPGQITPAASGAVALDSLVVSLVFTVVLTIARLPVAMSTSVISAFLGSAVLIWFGTQFGIPISIGQCLMGGMFGSAFTKQVAVLNGRLVLESVALWVLAPVGAFAMAFILLL